MPHLLSDAALIGGPGVKSVIVGFIILVILGRHAHRREEYRGQEERCHAIAHTVSG
jgi:hypothetical protein